MVSSTTRCLSLLVVLLVRCLPVSAGAATSITAIRFADLPESPEVACASPAVRSAWLRCKVSGPSPSCCGGLDAVLASRSSPSFGCLCMTKVLYSTITQASKLGLDVLATLQSCAKSSDSFATQWASGDHTSCPAIPLDARLADVLGEFGDAVVVPSSKSRKAWDWRNLAQFGEVMSEIPDVQSVTSSLFGVRVLQLFFLVVIGMPVVYLLLHYCVLVRFSGVYKQLSDADRLVACQHAVYAVVFTLSVVPQTVLALRALFLAFTGTYMASSELLVLLGVFIGSRVVLCTVEASTRSVIHCSLPLVIHHLMFFVVTALVLWSRDAAVLGLGLVLDLFICMEFPLYWALLADRLCWPVRLARGILRGAIAWYILTRIVQTVLLVYMIVKFAGMPAVNRTYEFIVTVIVCAGLAGFQAYTLAVYRRMDARLSKSLSAAAGTGADGGGAGVDEVVVSTSPTASDSSSSQGFPCNGSVLVGVATADVKKYEV